MGDTSQSPRTPIRRQFSTASMPSNIAELSSRLLNELNPSMILSPPPSPLYKDHSLRRKHLSTGSLSRYLSTATFRRSTTSNHINLDPDIIESVIEEVQRVPIKRCIAKEIVYSNGEKLYVTRPGTIEELSTESSNSI